MPHALRIEGAGMPPLLLEECSQRLEVIPWGGLHRTVNGELIYTGEPGQKKYRSLCRGKGKVAPGLDTLCRGDAVTVYSIQRLWQEARSHTTCLLRPAVEGTLLVMNHQRESVEILRVTGNEVLLRESPQDPLYVSYCPILVMRVVEMNFQTEEWEDVHEWSLTLEEI